MIVVLYFLPYFLAAGVDSANLFISQLSAIFAGTTAVVAFVAYLWAPRKYIRQMALVVYALLAITTANLLMNTGETASPFIALWIAVAVFAAVFGAPGLVMMALPPLAYLAYAFTQDAEISTYIIAIIAGFAPLIASVIIWHSASKKEDKKDLAYNELANELSQESSKASTVITAIEDGVISVNRENVIELINPAAQRIIGWSKGDALGLSYKSVVKLFNSTGNPIQDSEDPIQQVLATSKEVTTEHLTTKTESGKTILLSIVTSPLGQPTSGAIMVFRDVTKERKEEREQAEFISTASHEMRTPVASIEGYLGLALNPNTAQIDAKARDYITKAHESAQHLGRLFQDLLDVTKADDGRIGNNPQVVDAVEFVSDVLEGLRPQAVAKNIEVIYKPHPAHEDPNNRTITPVFYANVDNDHLREVVANLIENAIKYTLAGTVTVDVTGDENTIEISIKDSGIGIPAEDIPHLFQKFYRVDNTDTREIGGTGLGLYLCRRLAEVMGGSIRVESAYKEGSTFILKLPRLSSDDATRRINEASKQTPQPTTPAAQPAPVVQPPVATPQPTASAQPATPQPAPTPNPAPAQNVPLSQIEQNPRAYTNQTNRTVSVPVRNGDEVSSQ